MITNSTTERVKVLIKQVGLKQGDFAEQCGITPQSFSRAIKKGFSVDYLMRIANTFKVNYKWLYNGIGEMFAEEKAIGKAQFAAFSQMLDANTSPVSQNIISGDTKPAERIISRYRGKEWLLCPLDGYSDYKDFCHHWNDALKKIGRKEVVPDKVGRLRKVVWHPIVEGMTVYTARYTFASIGAELEIPRETIALCLGHSWADVTSHYIAYDTKRIDDAVARIVAYVEGS